MCTWIGVLHLAVPTVQSCCQRQRHVQLVGTPGLSVVVPHRCAIYGSVDRPSGEYLLSRSMYVFMYVWCDGIISLVCNLPSVGPSMIPAIRQNISPSSRHPINPSIHQCFTPITCPSIRLARWPSIHSIHSPSRPADLFLHVYISQASIRSMCIHRSIYPSIHLAV